MYGEDDEDGFERDDEDDEHPVDPTPYLGQYDDDEPTPDFDEGRTREQNQVRSNNPDERLWKEPWKPLDNGNYTRLTVQGHRVNVFKQASGKWSWGLYRTANERHYSQQSFPHHLAAKFNVHTLIAGGLL